MGLFSRLLRRRASNQTAPQVAEKHRRRFRLEALEDRSLMSVNVYSPNFVGPLSPSQIQTFATSTPDSPGISTYGSTLKIQGGYGDDNVAVSLVNGQIKVSVSHPHTQYVQGIAVHWTTYDPDVY